MTEKPGSLLTQKFEKKMPDGDDRTRSVCGHCGFIDYQNPKIVVGSVVRYGEKLLLCKRAIEPRRGYWTLPAGYMELGESVEEGAKREAWEEARAKLDIERVLAVYSIPRIGQVQIMFRARLMDNMVEAGPESLDVELFTWDEIPWADLAFPTVYWALQQWYATRDRDDFPVFSNPDDDFQADGIDLSSKA